MKLMLRRNSLFPRVFFVFDGIEYSWNGWFGCQLESYEFRRPPAGTTRELDFGEGKQKICVTIFSTHREWFWCRCTWAVSNSGTHEEHTTRIHQLRNALRELLR